MSDQDKIDQLQQELNRLAQNLKDSYKELQQVQSELNRLRGFEPGQMPVLPKKQHSQFSFENFIGLKLIHIIGIVVLVIGLSIGVKYAIDKELISALTRIVLAYAAGAVLLILSWRLREKYMLFSAILFSGGMASLYFTTYAAFSYYNFYSFAVAFLIMIGLTVYTCYEAVRYKRQEIAALGMIGAYSIPFLISRNTENALLFFSYILVINCGVAYLVLRMKWRLVEKMALLISWLFFISWSIFKNESSPTLFAIVIPVCFYVLFNFLSLAKKWNNNTLLLPGDNQNLLINHMAAGVAATALFSNAGFYDNMPLIIGLLAVYTAMVSFIFYSLMPDETIIQKSMAMLTAGLLVFYVGLEWDGVTVTFIWVALAAALFAWGIFVKKSWPRFASILLLALTLGKLVLFDSARFNTIQKIFAYIIIGTLLLVLSFLYQKNKDTLFRKEDM